MQIYIWYLHRLTRLKRTNKLYISIKCTIKLILPILLDTSHLFKCILHVLKFEEEKIEGRYNIKITYL